MGLGDADRDPLCLNEVAYPHKGATALRRSAFSGSAAWHSWVNQGVSLPRIRPLAARQTAQGALFCKQPAHGERSSASSLA